MSRRPVIRPTLWRGAAQISPAAAVLGLLFIAPLVWFFVVSFWEVKLFKTAPGVSPRNYAKVLTDYTDPIGFTATIAAVIAAVTTLLAFIVARMIWSRGGALGGFVLGATPLTLFGGCRLRRPSTS